jgi:tripartite-type tricarboxylate transporter receptor subunit TctC
MRQTSIIRHARIREKNMKPGTPYVALLIGMSAIVACPPATAQSYPTKEVKLIVPFPTAGVTDLNARILAKHLSRYWKQPVTASNMPGGGGTKGTMFVLGSAKDGYTMMMSATGQATQNPAIDSKLPYRWDEPTLVARTSVSPLVFVVKGDSPWRSLREVVDDVKKDPAKFRYGTSGVGGVGALALSLLFGSNGIDVAKLGRVELQGGGPLLEAVASGETHFAAQYLAEMGPQLQAKKLKPLAVSTPARVRQLPDAPTGLETGFGTFTLIGWNGIVGPAQLPAEIVGRWNDAIKVLAADKAFVAETEASGAEVAYLDPAKFKAALKTEYETALAQAVKLGLRK